MQAVKLFKEVLNLQGVTIRVRDEFSLDSTTLAQVADMGGWFRHKCKSDGAKREKSSRAYRSRNDAR